MKDNRYVQDGEEQILTLYFNSIGFGFALMKNPLEVIDKGIVNVKPANNRIVMQKVKRLIRKLKPERIVIEDYTGALSNKSERIIHLLRSVRRLIQKKGIPLSRYSREQIRIVFEPWRAKTRYEIAEVIARNVKAYENLLFDKPKYPRNEHTLSVQFDAASLGITHYYNSM